MTDLNQSQQESSKNTFICLCKNQISRGLSLQESFNKTPVCRTRYGKLNVKVPVKSSTVDGSISSRVAASKTTSSKDTIPLTSENLKQMIQSQNSQYSNVLSETDIEENTKEEMERKNAWIENWLKDIQKHWPPQETDLTPISINRNTCEHTNSIDSMLRSQTLPIKRQSRPIFKFPSNLNENNLDK